MSGILVLLCLLPLSSTLVKIEVDSSPGRAKRSADDEFYQPTTLKDNFKLVWTEDASDYAQSGPLKEDLMDFTVSFWIKTTSPGDYHQSYFDYNNDESVRALAFYRGKNVIYPHINGQYYSCGSYVFQNYWQHVVATWSNIDGAYNVWIDGQLFCQKAGFRQGDTIKKGGNFTLGQIVTRANPVRFESGYSFRGEMAYLNIYDKFVNSTKEVHDLMNKTLSDDEAVVPWKSFRHGIHGNLKMMPELDLYTKAYTHLHCGANNMTLTLKREGFKHLDPSKLTLLDDKCGATTFNSTHIVMSTDLSDCGTLVNYTTAYATYTNEIRQPKTKLLHNLRGVIIDAINRRTVPKSQTRITFECEYEVSERISLPAYATHIDSIHNVGHGQNRFSYRISLYHSSNFTTPFTRKEYPIQVAMEKKIYAEVAVEGEEARMDNWIESCRATPSANYNDKIHYDLISDGCPNKDDDTIHVYNSTASPLGIQRFSFKTFRFNSFPSAVVFLHCEMRLCNPGDKESRCVKGLSVC